MSNAGYLGLADDGGFTEYVVADANHFHKLANYLPSEIGTLVEPTTVSNHAV